MSRRHLLRQDIPDTGTSNRESPVTDNVTYRLAIGTGTGIPVSISVTRVPVRYRVALNTRLDFYRASA